MVNRAFFLDRDGVINEEVNYLHEPEHTVLIPGVAAAVRRLHRAGFLALVVTNQAGVAKGYYPERAVLAVHARIQAMLLASGGPEATIDGWYWCPHHPDFTGPCGCRKPRPGMLLRAAADFALDMGTCFMVGDRMSDLEAGRNAGCAASCLVRTGYGENEAARAHEAGFAAAADLSEAVTLLLR